MNQLFLVQDKLNYMKKVRAMKKQYKYFNEDATKYLIKQVASNNTIKTVAINI